MSHTDYEVVKDRLYLRVLGSGLPASRLPQAEGEHCFCVDESLLYFPFFLDYGPLNLGCLYKFCQTLNNKLTDKQLYGKRIILCTAGKVATRGNAVYLLAAHSLLCLGRSPEDAMRPFARMSPPLAPWHDASPTVDTFHLTTLDVLRGLAKAVSFKFFDLDGFDLWEYEHYEKVEAGDMNWIVQGRFLAFAGPHDTRTAPVEGYHCTSVDDLLPYFRSRGVTAVVRLNKKYYNERRFTAAGIAHHDMYYLDGSNPPEHILQRFLQVTESTPGAIAVHCKAGLGRTGTCIGAYMMKHYRMTAREVVGWMRVCRPGSVIGPQQQFLEEIQQRMWEEGEYFRTMKTVPPPAPGSQLLQYGTAPSQASLQPSTPIHINTNVGQASHSLQQKDYGAPSAARSLVEQSQSVTTPTARRTTSGPVHVGSPMEERSPVSSVGRVGTVMMPVSPGTRTQQQRQAAPSSRDTFPALHRPLASPATSPIAFAASGSLASARRLAPGSALGSMLPSYTSAGQGTTSAYGQSSGLGRPVTTGLSGAGGLGHTSNGSSILRSSGSSNGYSGHLSNGLLGPASTPAKGGGISGQGEQLRAAKARNSPNPIATPVGLPGLGQAHGLGSSYSRLLAAAANR